MPGSGPYGPQKEGPMWMTPQRLLPASPRAVATVSKGCVCNTSGLSSNRHNSNEGIIIRDDTHLRHHGQWRPCLKAACITPAASAALATTQRKTSSPAVLRFKVRLQRKVCCKNLHKLSVRQLGCCKNLHKTDQGASLLQEPALTALEATRLLQELAQN